MSVMSRVAGALLAAWVAPDVAVYAQGSEKRWEVEAHTGGTFASSPAGGTPIFFVSTGVPPSIQFSHGPDAPRA